MKLVSALALVAATLSFSGSAFADGGYIYNPSYRLTAANPSHRVTLKDKQARNVIVGAHDVLKIQGDSVVIDANESLALARALETTGVVKITPVNETRADQAGWDRATGGSGQNHEQERNGDKK